MDILKRNLAPITDAAWEELSEQAEQTLRAHLTARTFVDVIGPKGFDYSAVGLGRLDVSKKQDAAGVSYGIRRVLPLVEARAQLELDIWELDNVSRGAKDVDLDPVDDAAKAIARFEESAIYRGLADANIVGIASASAHQPITVETEGSRFAEPVTRALLAMQEAHVEGPYTLVLGPALYRTMESCCDGYPPRKRIENLIGGKVLLGLSLEGGFLVSTRGGDMELILGQDISLGYETHDTKKVRLYLSESFTFRMLEPAAAVALTKAKAKGGVKR